MPQEAEHLSKSRHGVWYYRWLVPERVYAVLMGSGVSRSARIPTGWEVTIELVRKAAALQGANRERIFQDIEQSLSVNGGSCPLVTSGLIGSTSELAQANMLALKHFIPQFRWR